MLLRIFGVSLVSFAFCLTAQTLTATTLYVSPQGDDQATGSKAAPLNSIQAAAERAMPGDTVLVLEGTYRERVAPKRGGEPGKPIIYRGEPGKRVFVKGSEVWTPEWKDEGNGIFSAVPDAELFDDRSKEYVDGHNPFEVELASTPWQREGRREAERRDAGEGRIGRTDERVVYTCGQVFVDGQQYKEVPLLEELEPKTWHYEPKSKRIHVNFGEQGPSEQLVEISTRRRLFAPYERGLGHLVVEGFIFEHCGNQYPTNFWDTDKYAQKGAVGTEAGHHWVIRRNVIRHAKTFAIDIGRVDRHTKRQLGKNTAYDNLIEENYILDNGSAGILTNGSLRLVIRNNVILRNNTLRFWGVKRWEQAGIKCHGFRDGYIHDNYIAHNYETYGIWLDNQFPDSRVARNVIHDNERPGIFLEMSDYGFDRLLVDNNVVFGNGGNAVYIHDASGATFTNNLLANTKPMPKYGQAVIIHQVMARTKTYHHSFYNNLMIGNPKNVNVNYPAFRSGIQRFDHNLYDVESSDREFVVTDKSDKPNPWSPEEFEQLMLNDLDLPKTPAGMFEKEGAAKLTFAEWQSFWEHHQTSNDRHSQCKTGSKVTYDPKTFELTLDINVDPKQIGAKPFPQVEQDLLGKEISKEAAIPGPFQQLKQGKNQFTIWNGLPMVDENQLPAAEWNMVESTTSTASN